MPDTNFDKILHSFFNFNLNIEQKLFRKIKFLDEEIEDQYKRETSKTSIKNKIITDASIISCYLATFIYTYVFNNKSTKMFSFIALACLAVCLILFALSYFKKSSSFNVQINHATIFLLSIFFNFKIIYTALCLNTVENDNDSGIIRTIIYDFVSKNILCLMVLDPRVAVTAVLYLFNLIAIIVAQTKSNSDHSYYFDGAIALVVTIFFYRFKKSAEVTGRSNFADKFKYENYYIYSRDFINGSNGFYLNLSNDWLIYCDPRLKALQNDIFINRFASKSNNFERLIEINDMSQSSKINEMNSLISNNNQLCFEGYKNNTSADVLTIFTLYKNEEESGGILNVKEKNLAELVKVLILEPSSKTFKNVGIYKLKSSSVIRYFEIYFRKFSSKNQNSVNDIMIYDITELVTSKQKILEEGVIKQKAQSKILNEFKVPVNSIIELIGGIENSISPILTEANQSKLKDLNTVINMSNYLIFLISDIIDFTNIKSLEEIKIILENINLREIVNFVFDILNSLLICNKVENEQNKPRIEFENDIDNLYIKADVFKLKQVLINLITKLVKFKITGCLKLKCFIDYEKECVMVILSNTRTGMFEEEKENSLDETKMLRNDVNPGIERGQDISICKALASSMNLTLDSFSYFGQSIEFSLGFPILQNSQLNNSKFTLIEESEYIVSNREIPMKELKLLDYHKTPVLVRRKINEIDLDNQENLMKKKRSKTINVVSSDFTNIKNRFLGFDLKTDRISQINLIPRVDIKDSKIESAKIEINIDTTNLKKKDIFLIVGANRFIREVTKNIIKKVMNEAGSDIEIILGSDGSDIIHHIISEESKGNEIKCVITEEDMKYLDGSEAILIIRNLEKLGKIKFVNIISVTDNEDPIYTNQIIETGAQIVLNKPLQKSVISRVFKDLNII